MRNVKEFLLRLDQQKMLAHIRCEVDCDLEIAEIHRRVIAAQGPALLFHQVKNSRFPVVTNLFGSKARMDLAFGNEPIQFLEELVHTAQRIFPLNSKKMIGAAKFLPRILRTGMKQVSLTRTRISGSRMLPVNIEALPMTKSWPEDGGAFLTLPLVYTEDPLAGGHNLGIYRMQRYDRQRLGMHWQIQKGGGFHYDLAEKRSSSLPVSVHLGGPPALLLAAIAPLPENVGELILASFIMGRKLRLTRLGNHPLPVVADCEFALLGQVPPRERHPEGPFGDHYGYYSLQHDYPVFQCQEIWHARDAVFPATVVGKPRQEDFYIGEYLQRLLSPLFPLVMPGVLDLWSYGETGFHSLAAAVVKERYHREAMVSAFRILGEGQLSLTKFLFVLDQRLDLSDFSKVLEAVLERADFRKDLYIFNHLSMDTLDYTGPEINKGSKAVLLGLGDPVRKLPERFTGELPTGFQGAQSFCRGCLVLAAPSYQKEPKIAAVIRDQKAFQDWPLIIVVDNLKKTLANQASFLWTTFTRFEPAADISAREQITSGHHIEYTLPLIFDARMKPSYPKELFCSSEIREKVSCRWQEYFPHGMDAGSSDDGNLTGP